MPGARRYEDDFLVESGLDLNEWRDFPFYEGRGCMECSGTGFRGRTAIHELLDLTEKIREMILERRPASEIKRAARDEGMTSCGNRRSRSRAGRHHDAARSEQSDVYRRVGRAYLSFSEQVQRWLSDPPPDHFFEIGRIFARRSLSQCERAAGEAGERGLSASPSAPNVLKPQLYQGRFAAGGRATRGKPETAALAIPDYAARMAILDFEQFPASETEAMALLRFRLRKSVPFHIEEAQVAYSMQLEEPKRLEVLAVAIARAHS